MKFIHTADWQIGMKAAHVGDAGTRVRDERLEAARRVLETAKQNNADFILVAGDTFEDNAVNRLLVQQVGDILAKFAGPVYMISGNHDPLLPGSVWEHPVWNSHANLHLLDKAEPLEVPGGMLYPSPLFEKYSPSDPTLWIDAQKESKIAIGLAHGTVQGVSEELDYPIPRDAATRAGLDYLALGHWHSYAHYPDSEGALRMAYSGTNETTKFGERDSGNVLCVEIQERGAVPKITPIRTGGLTWRSEEKEIRESGDLQQLCRTVEAIENPAATLLRVELHGILHPGDYEPLRRIEEIVGSRFFYGRVDYDRLLPSPADDQWLEEIPVGVLRDAALQLQNLTDPQHRPRADYATPEVATAAMTQLYRVLNEVKS